MGNNSLLNPFCLCGTFSATQFRWIQKGEETEKQSWAIDHVYIGEACPRLCSGHGYCTTGAVCICDESFQGLNPRLSFLTQERMRFSSTRVQRPLGNGHILQPEGLRVEDTLLVHSHLPLKWIIMNNFMLCSLNYFFNADFLHSENL